MCRRASIYKYVARDRPRYDHLCLPPVAEPRLVSIIRTDPFTRGAEGMCRGCAGKSLRAGRSEVRARPAQDAKRKSYATRDPRRLVGPRSGRRFRFGESGGVAGNPAGRLGL